MASSNSRPYNGGALAVNVASPYFIITITNFPDLVQRTQQYQIPNQNWHQHYHGGMLIPGVLVHFSQQHTSEHERLLYNTVRFQIEEIIREYLQRTQRPYPIYLIFDMSNMRPRL